MPKFSSFTGFGFLRFSSEPSEAEKIYKSMLGMYRDPHDGRATIDVAQGTYQEAKVFATSQAIAAAKVTVESAGAELSPETSYYTLEKHEEEFKIRPYADDTVVDRRAVLGAKQKLFNGPRYEAMVSLLESVLGEDNLSAYHPMTTNEDEAWPPASVTIPTTGVDTPKDGPGTFVRHDNVAKSIRLLGAVARCGARPFTCDSYSESNADGDSSLGWSTFLAVGQTFTGDGRRLSYARIYGRKSGSPTGSAYAKIYAYNTTLGLPATDLASSVPLAVSEPLDVSLLSTSNALRTFVFKGDQKITLASGTTYVLSIEYSSSSAGASNNLRVGTDGSSPGHAGKLVETTTGGAWTDDTSRDTCFYVHSESPYNIEIAYENSNKNEADVLVVPGDVLAVDVGNLGLAEKVKVLSARKDGTTRKFTANFYKPHSAGAFATTGPAPIWFNTKRHVLVVTPTAVALDPQVVRKVNASLDRALRGPTTWAIVQPTTPGAATCGPFKIGTTLGSPLGAVPVEQVTVI